jgi:Transposase, Mutator family
VSDDQPGLKAAIREVLPEAAWQRCYVHFLRNALDYVPQRRGSAFDSTPNHVNMTVQVRLRGREERRCTPSNIECATKGCGVEYRIRRHLPAYSWRGEKTSAALVQANADKTDRPIACGSCGNHRSCIIFELDGPRSVPAAEPSAYQYGYQSWWWWWWW